MKSFPLIAVPLAVILSYGCDGWIENGAALKQAPENSEISAGLLRGNIETTDYTAIVHILKGRVEGSPVFRRAGGYVNHLYRARVIETIRGPRHEAITFSVMAESDIDPVLPGYPVIVSLCGAGPDRLYVPDNGYELPASSSLVAAARACARQAKKSSSRNSVCSK